MMEGLAEFHALLPPEPDDCGGLPEFHALLGRDLDEAHRSAHVRNAFSLFIEAFSMRPATYTDTNLVARLLEMEEEKGVRWAA